MKFPLLQLQPAALLAALLLSLSGPAAQAQESHGGRGVYVGPQRGGEFRSPHWQLDRRYHHDHYYPSRGFVSIGLPPGAVSIGYGSGSYFFHGGVWFSPYGGRYRVVAPPFGIVVPLLPPAYTPLWIDSTRYYYANGTYYTAATDGGYTVVAPPPGAEQARPLPPLPEPKAAPAPIIYPRSGQSAQQTETDRQECNRWATTQPAAQADASVFQRAVAACMDGRGYTVR